MGALETFFVDFLGDPKQIGAQSWLHALSWVAALLLAILAWLSLRRQSLQSRATLHLSVYERWERLEEARKIVSQMNFEVRGEVSRNHGNLKAEIQIPELRRRYLKKLLDIRQSKTDEFQSLVDYMSFFEVMGLYVRKGYLPVSDVRLLYKGPILDLDLATREFIASWQGEAHKADGLLENALFLMTVIREREERPLRYFIKFRLGRMIGLYR